MKPPTLIILAAIALVAVLSFLATSCAPLTASRAQQLSLLGDKALEVAEAFGAIETHEAALVRQHGALVLTALQSDKLTDKLVAISGAAVAAARERDELTDAQVAALQSAGVVPLPPEPLPPPPEAVSLK